MPLDAGISHTTAKNWISILIPIEIKSSETVGRSLFDGLKYYLSLGPPVSETGVLIHAGNGLYQREQFLIRLWFQCI